MPKKLSYCYSFPSDHLVGTSATLAQTRAALGAEVHYYSQQRALETARGQFRMLKIN